ncbi:MAG: succinyl-diaminopimelate desuccinylase [Azospirillum brasilense]|nr:MAG: succinyl-diaminopimelate desuccinylase [Azospirillum brasilense]
MSDVIELAKDLIRCPSVTPTTAGVFDVIEAYLVPVGFTAQRVTFSEDGHDTVENLYLRYGTGQPNFCFAGHTDVVPPGDPSMWTVPPFHPEVRDGELYGRGAEDMKGAIAAFMVAAKQFVAANPNFPGSISFLITQDEEGWAVNGTRKMLDWLRDKGEVLSHCLVGEPTNPTYLGEMAKIGRRGSITFQLQVQGKQGHVAYPDLADNPVTRLVNMLHALKADALDAGNAYFPASNLEVTTVDVGNAASNVIPARASAQFNVRFNNEHTSADIEQWVRSRIAPFGAHTLSARVTGESFLTEDARLPEVLIAAVKEITGHTPKLSTTGGTSDARFIKDVCPVIEFGTTGRTPHMVDERVEVKTLEGLAAIYGAVLRHYFA